MISKLVQRAKKSSFPFGSEDFSCYERMILYLRPKGYESEGRITCCDCDRCLWQMKGVRKGRNQGVFAMPIAKTTMISSGQKNLSFSANKKQASNDACFLLNECDWNSSNASLILTCSIPSRHFLSTIYYTAYILDILFLFLHKSLLNGSYVFYGTTHAQQYCLLFRLGIPSASN